jgi:hypothetical protein
MSRLSIGRHLVSVDRTREAGDADWEQTANYAATPTSVDRRLFLVSIASLALAILVVVALWLVR